MYEIPMSAPCAAERLRSLANEIDRVLIQWPKFPPPVELSLATAAASCRCAADDLDLFGAHQRLTPADLPALAALARL